ncbi:hypothetical protein [Allorhizocola rhizosphaerae]|uniref:hypothetical protein n=1 Tax=Allorhizocola rhizosphaerae TaxID=1872709 RepID=UPI0013C36733|nr:hypothetical protein [Allorhizocola rhizosphaerae]
MNLCPFSTAGGFRNFMIAALGAAWVDHEVIAARTVEHGRKFMISGRGWRIRAAKTQVRVDVVALASADHGAKRRVVTVGEAKWGDKVRPHHVKRLRRAVELLSDRGYDVSGTKILCFGGSGFDREVTKSSGALSVSLDDLVAGWISGALPAGQSARGSGTVPI